MIILYIAHSSNSVSRRCGWTVQKRGSPCGLRPFRYHNHSQDLPWRENCVLQATHAWRGPTLMVVLLTTLWGDKFPHHNGPTSDLKR